MCPPSDPMKTLNSVDKGFTPPKGGINANLRLIVCVSDDGELEFSRHTRFRDHRVIFLLQKRETELLGVRHL
jgi:hypothetical protein